MTNWFKINTALIVCLAFVFRLLVVNVPMVGSFEDFLFKGTNKSCLLKKGKSSETLVQSSTKEYPAIEVCEENQDSEETESKFDTPVILSFLYSYFNRIHLSAGVNNAFDSIKCQLHPKKYLSLSILRI
jgi:hypothetical protein